MTKEQKQAFGVRLNELKERKTKAEVGYASKEELLSIANELAKLCSEVLSECTNNPE